jgi:hypothetical protein
MMARRPRRHLPKGAGTVICSECGARASADGKGSPIVLPCDCHRKPVCPHDPTCAPYPCAIVRGVVAETDVLVADMTTLMGQAPREDVMSGAAQALVTASHDKLAVIATVMLAMLIDERGSHAMTASNFEIFMESMREDADRLKAERDEARAEVVRLGRESEEWKARCHEARQRRRDRCEARDAG